MPKSKKKIGGRKRGEDSFGEFCSALERILLRATLLILLAVALCRFVLAEVLPIFDGAGGPASIRSDH
jgi:hypothetical protein